MAKERPYLGGVLKLLSELVERNDGLERGHALDVLEELGKRVNKCRKVSDGMSYALDLVALAANQLELGLVHNELDSVGTEGVIKRHQGE